jgi:hypothetical protein
MKPVANDCPLASLVTGAGSFCGKVDLRHAAAAGVLKDAAEAGAQASCLMVPLGSGPGDHECAVAKSGQAGRPRTIVVTIGSERQLALDTAGTARVMSFGT